MTERQLRFLKNDGIDPEKIEKVCGEVFEILETQNFTLKETDFLLSSMKSILRLMTKDDPLRKVGGFDYFSSIKEQLSLEASSKTAS
ncbi:MAG TPA: hypothetical protein IAA09_12440 [Candidatus Lachnoclostridium avicola]|nr:hypothetical protein [Candidatus Lachnoclostridium avicola]